jgi:hypothetical protein
MVEINTLRVGEILYTTYEYGEAMTGTGASSGPNAASKDFSGVIDILPFVTLNNKRYKVTEIGAYSFYGCSSATGVKIPPTIILIRARAFSSMNLDEIVLPGSIIQIETLGIDSCQNTRLITFCGTKTAEFSSTVEPRLSLEYKIPVNVPLNYYGTTFCGKNVNKIDLTNKCMFKETVYSTNHAACTVCRHRRFPNVIFMCAFVELRS